MNSSLFTNQFCVICTAHLFAAPKASKPTCPVKHMQILAKPPRLIAYKSTSFL